MTTDRRPPQAEIDRDKLREVAKDAAKQPVVKAGALALFGRLLAKWIGKGQA